MNTLKKTAILFLLPVSAGIFLLFQAFIPGTTRNLTLTNDTMGWPQSFGFGRPATLKQIRALDISIRPDGKGLPPGAGTVSKGRQVYLQKCLSCHGSNVAPGPYSMLFGKSADSTKAKTIGNYWPYSTTIFDYVRRAMPFNAPGSLTDNEVYSVTAYLLHENRIIDSNLVINSATLPGITMPAKKLFINDDRKGGAEIK